MVGEYMKPEGGNGAIQKGPHKTNAVVKAITNQVNAKYSGSTKAARNARIRKDPARLGTMKIQKMNPITSILMALSLRALRALSRIHKCRTLPYASGCRMDRSCRANSSCRPRLDWRLSPTQAT